MSDDLSKRLNAIRKELDARKALGHRANEEGQQTARDRQQALIDAEGPASRFSHKRIHPRFNEIQKQFPRAVGEEISKRAVIEGPPGVEGWMLSLRDDRLYLLVTYDHAEVTLVVRTQCGDRTVFGAEKSFPAASFDDSEDGEPAAWLGTHSGNAAAQLLRETAHADAYRTDVVRLDISQFLK